MRLCNLFLLIGLLPGLLAGTALPARAALKETPARVLSLDVDHGVALTLSAPAASVFIANPDIADLQVMSPTAIMLFGKRTGETSFMATDAHGHTLEQRTIRVVQDLSALSQELALAIPGHTIKASTIPNGIILTGEAPDAATVTDAYKIAQRYLPNGGDIINRIRVSGGNQIQIRVRFAEVAKTVNESLGIDWNSAVSYGGVVFGIASGADLERNALGQLIRPNNASLAQPNDVLALSHTGQRLNLNNAIDALAQDGLVTILAEPNLTAMSGETANFLAGGEFPIPIPQGNGTISIEFKNYGISLAFTPTLLGGNRVSLHVKPEVSELTTNGSITLQNIAVPALTTRRAETTVEVASGQSFAIAGLLDNQQTQTVNKYPILGDIPILGALFRSNQFQHGETELVIIITPYIVRPNGEQQLALPTDGFSPPSEVDRLLLLRNSASDPNARPISGPPLAVPALSPPAPTPVQHNPVAPIPPESPDVRSGDAPVPVAAPVTPVATLPPASPSARAAAAPRAPSPDLTAPAGPGGFTLE